jgi:hypothetical protein
MSAGMPIKMTIREKILKFFSFRRRSESMDKAALEASLNLLDIFLIGFGILVAIGVAGESVAGFLHWRRSNQLQAIQAEEILGLQAQISDANARASEATAQASQAQLELQKFKSPRTISAEQAAKITDDVKKFAKTPFVLGVFQDAEALELLKQVDVILTSAGWVEQAWKGGGDIAYSRPGHANIGSTYVTGVFVQADESHMADFGPIVVILAKLLSDAGVDATPEVGKMPANTNIDAIKILIGQKPK